MTIDRTPTYNLQAVVRETGLKPDVLRAWERRYNLPVPRRSDGGHRLYSAYDIETLKWLQSRQAEGLSISRAVDLWQEILLSGRDPLASYERNQPASNETSPIQDSRLDNLRISWLEACFAFDDRKAEEILNQAFALHPVEIVCSEIMQKGLRSIGQSWYDGKISAQQEHFAAAMATRRLETLISATPPPTRRHSILVGCPPGEWHTLPALMFSLFLRRKGYKVIFLGANIPVLQIAETATFIQPDLLILAAQLLTSAASLQKLAESLQTLNISIAYGGLIFSRIPELRQRIPAHFLGDNLPEGLQKVEGLLAAPSQARATIQPDPSSRATARLFKEHRPLIELELAREIRQAGLKYEYLEEASIHFTNGLVAALELGDIRLLEADLEWVDQLHIRQHIPGERMKYFLDAYKQALNRQLGNDGAPIVEWIDEYLAVKPTKDHE